jgi:hypothetical protein
VSYGSTLRLLGAIARGRPLSICTTDGNYIAPPDFMCLATAECAAHGAAYMVWSCWEPAFRDALAGSVARYHDFLRTNEHLFIGNGADAEIVLLWPYENWLRRSDCPTASLARELSAANLQYRVVTESQLDKGALPTNCLIVHAAEEDFVRPTTAAKLRACEAAGGRVAAVTLKPAAVRAGAETNRLSVTNSGPLSVAGLRELLDPPSVTVKNQPGVRAVVDRTSGGQCLLHLYNLNVARTDSYRDQVTPAENVEVTWYLPVRQQDMKEIQLLTPDEQGISGSVKCASTKVATRLGDRVKVEFVVPKLWIWTMVQAEAGGR